jgi:methionyl-tRNA formyltransferase
VRIVFMGSPEFAIPPLLHLMLNGYEIAAVYTRPDKPGGRGQSPIATPVKKAASDAQIPVIQEISLKKPEAIERLAAFKPEAIVVAAFGQILPQAVLDIPCYGCINIHPSLLPKYRGPSPVPGALLAGDDFIGVSIMRLDAGMDTGPVFSRAQIPVTPSDNTVTLLYKLFQVGARMLLEVLAFLPGGKLLPEPQDPAGASYTKEITREDGLIDWKLPAPDICRRIRAYQPWPEAYTYWQGKQLKIIEAVPLNPVEATEAGRVVTLPGASGQTEAAFGVGTGNGLLGVVKVQIEGKRAMPAGDFIRGQRDFAGSMLG